MDYISLCGVGHFFVSKVISKWLIRCYIRVTLLKQFNDTVRISKIHKCGRLPYPLYEMDRGVGMRLETKAAKRSILNKPYNVLLTIPSFVNYI